jgi:hypothetical protein
VALPEILHSGKAVVTSLMVTFARESWRAIDNPLGYVHRRQWSGRARHEVRVPRTVAERHAAPGGPRYDETMSPEERSSANNGIWMCRDHGKAIDSTDSEFTVERLRESRKRDDEWSDGFEQRFGL